MKKYYIGCDLGGTNLRAGIVDLDDIPFNEGIWNCIDIDTGA